MKSRPWCVKLLVVFGVYLASLQGGYASASDPIPTPTVRLAEDQIFFRWPNIEAADQYLWRLFEDDGATYDAAKKLADNYDCWDGTCNHIIRMLPQGRYRYQVGSFRGDDLLAWSEIRKLEITQSSGEQRDRSPSSPTQSLNLLPRGDYRLAINVDGNFHDPDDWASTAMIMALLDAANIGSKLVHYSYSCSIGDHANDRSMEAQMTTTVTRGLYYFDLDDRVFIDCQDHRNRAIEDLKNAINEARSDRPLYIIAAGPMEVIWRAFNRASPDRHRFVSVVSHSIWNDEHVEPPTMTRTANDIRDDFDVTWIAIELQNGLYPKQAGCDSRVCTHPLSWKPWEWLLFADHPGLRFVHRRMVETHKPDVSDAGMMYYFLTRDEQGTPSELRRFFGEWVDAED